MLKVMQAYVQNNKIVAIIDNPTSRETTTYLLTFWWERHWQRGDRASRITRCTVSIGGGSYDRVEIRLGLTPEASTQTKRDHLVPQQLVGGMWRAVQNYLKETKDNVGPHNQKWVPRALDFIKNDVKFIVAIEKERIQVK